MELHSLHKPPVSAPVVGHIHQVDTLDDAHGVEEEALSLKQQLSSADRDKTRLLLVQLKALHSRVPTTGRKARRMAGMIIAAIAQAEHQLEAQEDETYNHNYNRLQARRAFIEAVYNVMNRVDRDFFHTIDKNAIYKIAPVSESGVVVTSTKEEVTGEELQHKFSILKYHSLSEQEKRDVLHRTFGTQAGDELPTEVEALRRQRVELAELQGALRHMEAYRAYLHFTQSAGYLMGAMGKIGSDHEIFAKAHVQLAATLEAYDRLIADPSDEQAKNDLKRLRTMMRQTLKDEVINRVLGSTESSENGMKLDIFDAVTPPCLPLFTPHSKRRDVTNA
jgi:hypothetical protein